MRPGAQRSDPSSRSSSFSASARDYKKKGRNEEEERSARVPNTRTRRARRNYFLQYDNPQFTKSTFHHDSTRTLVQFSAVTGLTDDGILLIRPCVTSIISWYSYTQAELGYFLFAFCSRSLASVYYHVTVLISQNVLSRDIGLIYLSMKKC